MKATDSILALEKEGHVSHAYVQWMLASEEDANETATIIAAAINATAKAHAKAATVDIESRYVMEGADLWKIDKSGKKTHVKKFVRNLRNIKKLHLKIKH